jgi:hypothetical protein
MPARGNVMTAVAVLTAAALAVAGPDLVTIAGVLRGRGGPRRRVSAWPLVSVMVVAHAALGVAAMLNGQGAP